MQEITRRSLPGAGGDTPLVVKGVDCRRIETR